MRQTAQHLGPASLGNDRGTSSPPEGKRALPGSAFCLGPGPAQHRPLGSVQGRPGKTTAREEIQHSLSLLPPFPLPLSTPEDLQGWSEADPPGSFHSLSRPPKPSPSTKWGERLLPSRTKMLQVAKLDSSLISALTGCVTQDRSFFKHLKSRFAYQ